LALTTLNGNDAIVEESTSFVYRVVDYDGTTIEVDRPLPDLSSISPTTITVIKNGYYPHCLDRCSQHDSWTLNIVWSDNPAGFLGMTEDNLYDFESNIFVSSNEFFGYNTYSGQTYNTGTTINDSIKGR